MERRTFIKTVGAASIPIALAGCAGTKKKHFVIRGFGLTKKGESAASYVTVENIDNDKHEFECALAAFDDSGVRVSDWRSTYTDYVQPGEERRAYVVWDTDSGWFSKNSVGQVVQSYESRARAINDGSHPAGPEYSENDTGKTFAETPE